MFLISKQVVYFMYENLLYFYGHFLKKENKLSRITGEVNEIIIDSSLLLKMKLDMKLYYSVETFCLNSLLLSAFICRKMTLQENAILI